MPGIICSYYTPGPYAREADRLRRSLDRLHLAHRLEEVSPFANWSDAVRYKPHFLAEMREVHSESDLLFVDADAVIWRDPWPILIDKLNSRKRNVWIEDKRVPDIGVHFLNRQVQSGTIFLPVDGPRTDKLLVCWINEDKRNPVVNGPQQVLGRILSEYRFESMALGASLCWIFDISAKRYPMAVNAPYVEHLQASRDYRNSKSSQHPGVERRHKRIEEIEEVLAC